MSQGDKFLKWRGRVAYQRKVALTQNALVARALRDAENALLNQCQLLPVDTLIARQLARRK